MHEKTLGQTVTGPAQQSRSPASELTEHLPQRIEAVDWPRLTASLP